MRSPCERASSNIVIPLGELTGLHNSLPLRKFRALRHLGMLIEAGHPYLFRCRARAPKGGPSVITPGFVIGLMGKVPHHLIPVKIRSSLRYPRSSGDAQTAKEHHLDLIKAQRQHDCRAKNAGDNGGR
jgi:hypothetical protein